MRLIEIQGERVSVDDESDGNALGRLGRKKEAAPVLEEMRALRTNLEQHLEAYISPFVPLQWLREELLEGLRMAGLKPGPAK